MDKMRLDEVSCGSIMVNTPRLVRKLYCQMAGDAHTEVANEELVHVYFELKTPPDLLKLQTHFDAVELLKIEPIEPIINHIVVMPINSCILDSTPVIVPIDMPTVVSNLGIGFDVISTTNSFVGVDSVIEPAGNGEMISDEPIQVHSKFGLPIGLAEVHTSFNDLNLLHVKPLELVTKNVVVASSSHSKTLNRNSDVDQINAPTDGFSDFNAIAINDLVYDLMNDFGKVA